MKNLLFFLAVALLWRRHEAVVQSGGVLLGSSAILPCHINTNDRLSQITWQRTIKGKAPDDVFLTIQPMIGPSHSNGKDFRFEFIGNFNNKNGTLKFSDVTLNDEGSYTCIFSLFPSGKQSRNSQLVILVPPITNLMDYTPLEGNEEVPLATCTAAASKPKADVRWIKGSLEGKVREELKETQHANGTTTTWSTLLGKPGREMNGQLVKCVISSEATKEDILETNILVHYSPGEVKVTERSADSFECETEANPNATFTWTRAGQSLPESIKVEGGVLQFASKTSDLSGLYQCEAGNMFGNTTSYVFVRFSSESSVFCWVLFGLFVLSGAVGLLYLCWSGKFSDCKRLPWWKEGPSGPGETNPLH
ncbi:nectin-4 isoform X2 [Oryzias latipes]